MLEREHRSDASHLFDFILQFIVDTEISSIAAFTQFKVYWQ